MDRKAQSDQVARFGAFEVDLRAGELRKSGVRIKLQEQPFQVLAALLERPGEVVTREEIRQRLWSGDTYVDFDRSLNIAVAKIREALGDSPSHPRFVETLPRRGYRFVYPVAGTGGEPPSSRAAARSDEKEPAEPPTPVIRKNVLTAGIVLVALVAVAMAITFRVGEKPSQALISEPVQSIAVLPLENLSGDPEQDYFADGMTDMLITDLGMISALRVISRTSVMQYKGARKPLPEIGRELDVSHVLEGTILREGDRVRIGVRLMEAESEQQIWGNSYERPVRQVLPLQREIARAVADAVQVSLNPAGLAQPDSNEEVSREALDAYLRGLDVMTHREKGGLRLAVEFFEEAIEKSPNYALAYSSMGACYFMQSMGWDQHLTTAEAARKARLALDKALRIDESLASAHYVLAEIRRHYDYDWDGAEEGFRRSLALNPNRAGTHVGYGHFLTDMGRFEEAKREMTLARRLDPNSPIMRMLTSRSLDMTSRIPELQSLVETELASFHLLHVGLGEAYLSEGMHDEALVAFENARGLSDDNFTLAWLGRAYAVTGKTHQAREILNELLKRSKERPVSSDHFAMIYVGLGERDRALEAIEKAYSERSPALTALRVEPVWDPLRTHPRFQVLLKKMKFPE